MTSEEIMEVEVMFDFEIIDFYEFAEKTNKEVFDRSMIDFGKSHHMDYWDWFEFFKKNQPHVFYPMWDLFVESEYPHSHRLVEPTSKKMEEGK